ncbi:MAG: hypothetical protein U0Q22_01530 [Acidimicrobiales bacterium]
MADMSLRNFDDPRVGRALVKRVMTEIARLGEADDRILNSRLRMRRRRSLAVELSLVVSADSSWEAFDYGASVLRASIHAAGGTSVGWERIVPAVLQLSGGGEPAGPTWESASRAATRRAVHRPLPAFAAAAEGCIDLR